MEICSPPKLDPAALLSSGVQIYFPLTRTLSVGILFESISLIKVYIQQIAMTEDIVIQVKIIQLNLPFALGFLFFNCGLACFYTASVIKIIRSLTSDLTKNMINDFRANFEEALKKSMNTTSV